MKRLLLAMLLLLMPAAVGCSMSEALFCAFGDFYSDGGSTPDERKRHYDQQFESASHRFDPTDNPYD